MDVPFQMTMSQALTQKPKAIFFQYRYDVELPAFLLLQAQDHIRCLSEFFDVSVIHHDCDFMQICDTYKPELAIFEGGIPNPGCRKLRITNIRGSHVPKIGLLNADSFSSARAGFLSDMDHWGIETFFAIAATAREHMAAVADNLFIWPNSIDPGVYHDYQQTKVIPVLFTGNSNALYPWRQRISRIVSSRYPSMICPHPGYAASKTGALIVAGEAYARMLNASSFVPACGTVAKEVVRKHFEVPACKACLVTEKTPAIEAAGFRDLVNCVFADDRNVIEKLAYLFSHRDALETIIDTGYQLVHSSHTYRQRSQILEWFVLNGRLKQNERIVQRNMFGSLGVVSKRSGQRNLTLLSDGQHLALLNLGDSELEKGDYEAAEIQYLKCLSFIPYMPEAKLRIALCDLYRGMATRAMAQLESLLRITLAEYGAIDPDPVEWGYYLVTLLCQGKAAEAFKRSREFEWLHHVELNRVRRAINVLTDQGPHFGTRVSCCRPSIHQLPSISDRQWFTQLCVMLHQSGQSRMAAKIRNAIGGNGLGTEEIQISRTSLPTAGKKRKLVPDVARRNAIGSFKRSSMYHKARMAINRIVKQLLYGMEHKYGYFLPYRMSSSREDELYRSIEELVCERHVKTALVIGASAEQNCTRALLAGAARAANRPIVVCIGTNQVKGGMREKTVRRNTQKNWYWLSNAAIDDAGKCQEAIAKIKERRSVKCFDLILIDGSEMGGRYIINDSLREEMEGASYVFLDDITKHPTHEICNSLRSNDKYLMVVHSLAWRDGYAVFRNISVHARVPEETAYEPNELEAQGLPAEDGTVKSQKGSKILGEVDSGVCLPSPERVWRD
jgi:tetratricopeptide (TPR) repeat protein